MAVAHSRVFQVLLVLVLLTLALPIAGCGAGKPVIKLHDSEFKSIQLNNAIAQFIIEKGYGYPVETVVMTAPLIQKTLETGEVDLLLEGWQQNYLDWYDEQIQKGNIVNLGMIYEGGPQFFTIPRWVAEQYNIRTVFDMAEHWELFKDPEDPSKGVFYSCVISWNCAEINRVKMEAYGLTKYYNIVSPGTADAMEAAMARPQQRQQPVFGYYWAPTALMGAHDWYILEEPPYNEETWAKIAAAQEDESLRPIDEACAYETLPIDILAASGLLEKAPDVVEMLKGMNVGLEPINKVLAWADENKVESGEQVAIHYLLEYEDRWQNWVTPEARDKVMRAIEEVSG
jgi:glycine betaine/proline transport system substrate-binding protein